jgi:hypothetical protein
MSDNEENDEYSLENEEIDEYSLNSDTSEEEHMLNIYDPEEISKTKFTIVICELYNSKKHGIPDANSGVEYHFITENRLKILDTKLLDYLIYTSHYMNMETINEITPHTIFRNYRNIVMRPDNIKPEIAECLYLSGGECVAILKTFWIKIIQRTWKNIILERKKIIKLRCNLKSIIHREVNGKWPNNCLYLPSLKGMLA